MPNITTCTKCGAAYEASSEEAANSPDRLCRKCLSEQQVILNLLREGLVKLSGSGKRLSTQRRHGLYSSITVDGFQDMPAVRDTLKRFDDFGIGQSLEHKTVLDIGANVGAMAFEAAKRGAVVIGIEYREDRVKLTNGIAAFAKLPVTLYQGDLRDLREEQVPLDVWRIEYDIVMCCSVDEYIDDRQWLYTILREHTREVLYLESNVQRDQTEMETIAMLYQAGFKSVDYLGNGHSGGISRKRKLFMAT